MGGVQSQPAGVHLITRTWCIWGRGLELFFHTYTHTNTCTLSQTYSHIQHKQLKQASILLQGPDAERREGGSWSYTQWQKRKYKYTHQLIIRGGEGKRGSEGLWVSPPHTHIETSAHWMLVHICPAYGWCLASKYSPHLTCNLQSLNRWLGCIWITGPQTFDLQCDLHPAWAIWELCINGWCIWNVWL